MKLKKSTVVSIVVVILFGGLSTGTKAEDNNTSAQDINSFKIIIAELEKTINAQAEQIRQMEKEIDVLRKQLDEQIKENNKLRGLNQKENRDNVKNEDDLDSETIGRIVYQGIERDKEWFDRTYKMFYDKIALVDGKFLYKIVLENGKMTDISESFEPPSISHNYVKVGTIVKGPYQCKVLSVIGEGEALIMKSEIVFHVSNFEYPLIDGQDVGFEYLICVGTYEYTAANGAKKTVQSFKPCKWEPPKPLTKKQFADALKSGFELVTYVERQGKMIKVPIR